MPLDAEHVEAPATFRHCFPPDAFDCWFYSSPFSLSVLENHKETPRCSCKSCQCDSSRIEHMVPSSGTNKDIATFSAVASFLLPAWPPLAWVRWDSVHAWLARCESPGPASWPSSHSQGAPWRVRPGLGSGGCEINMEASRPVGVTQSLLYPTRPGFSKSGLFTSCVT